MPLSTPLLYCLFDESPRLLPHAAQQDAKARLAPRKLSHFLATYVALLFFSCEAWSLQSRARNCIPRGRCL